MDKITDYRKGLKEKIIEHAMNEFYKRGIKAVKMDEISQGLHVSKRTVYEIFGDKEELLLLGTQMEQERMKQQIDYYATHCSKNVIEIFAYFYRLQMEKNEKVEPAYLEDLHKYPRVLQYLRETGVRERAQRHVFYDAGIKEGYFRRDVDFDLLSKIGNLAMQEIMRQQLYKEYTLKTLFDNYFLLMIRGFCTELGLIALNKAISEQDAQSL